MEFACCKICFKEYKNTGNTTNFLVHINSEHKPHSANSTDQVHVGNTEQHQTPSGPSLSQRTLDFNNNACVSRLGPEKKKKIDETLYKLVIGKMLPPSIVDNDYFIGFVKALDPR
ncbi:hypothetical protein FSP39_008889 [Pinctada imbricata]|nr:hypothetical protein FSP39_008889 [Pinctada imbricata]